VADADEGGKFLFKRLDRGAADELAAHEHSVDGVADFLFLFPELGREVHVRDLAHDHLPA
jgi:hypothetical protein